MASSNFQDWLQTSRTDFLQGNGSGWLVCMGNQAGDLDSIASALGLAFLQHQSHPDQKTVALHQFRREDLRLRKENRLALTKAGVDPANLLTLDDVSTKNLSHLECDFGLVDHNALGPLFGNHDEDGRVKIVIDHHSDDGKHKAIVIDTGNLKQGGKAIPVDYEAMSILSPASNLAQATVQLNIHNASKKTDDFACFKDYFHSLRDAKSDILGLSGVDNLRRDYKEYTGGHYKLGISSVPVKIDDLAANGDLYQSIQQWTADQKLSHVAITASFQSQGKSQREMLLYAADGRVVDLIAGLKGMKELNITDSPRPWITDTTTTAVVEHDHKATRKQMAPALNAVLAKL